jgi:hypothetical protein
VPSFYTEEKVQLLVFFRMKSYLKKKNPKVSVASGSASNEKCWESGFVLQGTKDTSKHRVTDFLQILSLLFFLTHSFTHLDSECFRRSLGVASDKTASLITFYISKLCTVFQELDLVQ